MACPVLSFANGYHLIMPIIVRIRTITNKPAAEMAAFVNWPEMAEAIVKPARMRVTIRIRTAPRGVRIMLTMPLVALLNVSLL